MSKAKNMHYLSQFISRNFVKQGETQTFLEYNPKTNVIEERNIKKLFSKRKTWGQEFEDVLSGDNYENSLAPIIKELANRKISIGYKIVGSTIEIAQYNGVPIDNEYQEKMLSKLLLQTILLQRSNAESDEEIEKILSEFFKIDLNLHLKPILVEICPFKNYSPLVLIDSMLFMFACPSIQEKQVKYHMCFAFPISENRMIMWINQLDDYYFFAKKFSDINYLNLCRIEQHNKLCKIALGKSPKNERYLKILVAQIEDFSTNENIKVKIKREWE